MRKIVGMATFAGREKACEIAIKSLENQVDEIILYDNSKSEIDLTDNGKFVGLQKLINQKEDAYYFTCDDDILYPPDYIEKMTHSIDRTKSIVTHHGRKLLARNRNYYRGHQSFRCFGPVGIERRIDVCGTGVTGFRTDIFNPSHICYSEDKKMSDLIFSLAAVIEGVNIYIQPHEQGWIKQIPIDFTSSIYETENKSPIRQNEIANKIFSLRYG